jgi:sterol desaturase/sphingolipid hydroxylase (fatty acid hydroxylase superfamily)
MTTMAILVMMVLLAGLERVPGVFVRPARLWRAHAATDVVYLLTGYVGGASLALAWVAAAGAALDAWTSLGSRWDAVPFGVQVAAALVALDLGNFACHWLLHRVDALWRFHEVHHSSLHLDWLATFRSHLVEQGLRRGVAPALLILLGVPLPAVAVAAAIFVAWSMLIHANVRLPLGALERHLVGPRYHRVHHVPATTERNLGTLFVWWDRLLGTAVASDPPPRAAFGLPQGRLAYPQSWGAQLLAPFVRSDGVGLAARGGAGGRARRVALAAPVGRHERAQAVRVREPRVADVGR